MKRAGTYAAKADLDRELRGTRGASGHGCATASLLVALGLLASCGAGTKSDARYPPRPEGCDVNVVHGKVAGIAYDDIGHVDSICGTDVGTDECLRELKNQTCKLGGDIVYDVPDEPLKPTPDKIRYTGRAAHTRTAAAGAGKAPPR